MRDVIIYSDNGVLEDLTPQLNSRTTNSKVFSLVSSEDAIYIGSLYPFTSKYFRQTSPNVTNSTLIAQYWDGTEWRPFSSITDETGLLGVPFSNSGYISVSTDKRYTWTPRDTSENGVEAVTGLGDVNLYQMYWMKITYDTDIDMTLDWVGDMFCSDEQIRDISPRVMGSVFMTDWEAGKVDWEDQRATASELVIAEMQGINLNNPNLLLAKGELYLPTVFRTLALIYSEMGDDERATKYSNRSDMLIKRTFSKDTDQNGRAKQGESRIKTPRMVR